MGAKHVCFTCRQAFNAPYGAIGPTKCPTCSGNMVKMAHRFRPPKKREVAKWEVAKYLVDHGFYYQHIYEHPWGGQFMPYPATMHEAREFVKIYKVQASKESIITNVPVSVVSHS